MIVTMEVALTRTVPAPTKMIALVVALAGLFLMLGVSFGSSHAPGDAAGPVTELSRSLPGGVCYNTSLRLAQQPTLERPQTRV